MTADSDPIPETLRWAVRLLQAESVALGLVALFLVYENLTATATDRASALWLVAFALGGAASLWFLAGALTRRRAGARAPAFVLELMLLPVGYYMIQGGLGWLGLPLFALGLLVAGLLLSTPTTRALGR